MTDIRPEVSVFMSVHTQFENAGDALIVRELISLAAESTPTFVDLSRCPAAFRKSLRLGRLPGVEPLERLGALRLFGRMLAQRFGGRRAVYFLSPGGRGGELTRGGYLRARLSNYILKALSSLGVEVCHVGVSYDHLGPRHIDVLRHRSRILAYHAVRDEITREHLTSAGIRVDAVTPDLALNRFRCPQHGPRGESAAIAFSFRRDKYPEKESDLRGAVDRIVQSLGPNVRVKLVSQVARDDAFMSQIHEHVIGRSDREVELHLCSSSIDDCREVYMDCALIYSNRLHALLLAASVGATPIAVIDRNRDAKIVGVFEGLGLESLLIPIESASASFSPPTLDREALARVADELRLSVADLLRPGGGSGR